MTIDGFDYASVDGNQPPMVANTCAKFVYQRGAFVYKGRPTVDRHMVRDRDEWGAANVPWGAYLILAWDRRGSTPEEQVAKFVDGYGDRRPGELPPALDLEADDAASVGHTHPTALVWAHRAYDALVSRYGQVVIYTSDRVWRDVFGNLISKMGWSPLWLKTGYPYKTPVDVRKYPDIAARAYKPIEVIPRPWRSWTTMPGAWIHQWQGDALGVPGFTSTVDLNRWKTFGGAYLSRSEWVRSMLQHAGITGYQSVVAGVRHFQAARELVVDGVVGPRTFAALTR